MPFLTVIDSKNGHSQSVNHDPSFMATGLFNQTDSLGNDTMRQIALETTLATDYMTT